MIATKSPFTVQRISSKKIPSYLIYEIMDGKPIYYKGYKEVLAGKKTIEEIMGASSLQTMIIQYVLRILFRNLDEKKYHILTNESGLHLSKNNNLSGDIQLFETDKLSVKEANKHYLTIPPKINIEVDIDADTETFGQESYIYQKTEKLLNFGVEKVIWILSANKKVLVATQNENWQVINWHKDIEILDDLSFNIGKYLQENESPFA